MKKIFFILGVSALFLSCNKAPETEEDRIKIALEHLNSHYKEPEYVKIYTMEKVQRGFSEGKPTNNFKGYFIEPTENHNPYIYYDKKGDEKKGTVIMVSKHKTNGEDQQFVKYIILSKEGEIVYCGSEYPQYGGTGECTCKMSNLVRCHFDI